MNMKKYLPLIVMLLAILACALPPAMTPDVSATSVPAEQSPATNGPAAGATGTGTLRLWILSPLEGAVVSTSIVEIVGEAPAGAVISIGDDILIVGADGRFKHLVSLQEGPNVIEILASDASGNESYLLLAVFYEP